MVSTTRKKCKIIKINAAEESEHIEEGEPSIQKLQDLQDELDEVKDEANEKILKLKHKYKEKLRSVYHKRKKLITSIPEFWLTAFLNHPGLGDLVTEDDRKVFKYLKSLDVEEFKNVKSTYSITFNFSPNPYFKDANLSKTFSFSDEGVATKITGTKIKWEEGMDIANGINREKKGSKRPFVEESFFTWFNEAQQEFPEGIHDEVAEIIKGDLWPNPLKYFNNVSDEDGFEGEEEDEKDSDGEKNGDEEFEVDGDGEKNLDNHSSTNLDAGTDLVQSHENELSFTVDVGHVFQTEKIFRNPSWHPFFSSS
ncbi:NAP1-related protein 2-like isoform X2 [Papaver somniferum]|uniref:NAP1-related protein 2-like isoform X2 n=1 Tax=Papaver somniferum TaxID=3469 RepID=UPI000E706021|nr:NAP1-related protein 2-like isoform X2 [Papaver somniferum]XP_026409712.1 NAP1-related protein 2-like isoform X2 [Papaver somniferum]